MPVVIVNDYCSRCQCDSCRAIRYPETPEETGRRCADEVFAKMKEQLDKTGDSTEAPDSEQDDVPDSQHAPSARHDKKPRPATAYRAEPATTEHFGQVTATAIAESPYLTTLTEGQVDHIASEERKASQRRTELFR